MPRLGKASEDSDFNFDITEALHGSLYVKGRDGEKKLCLQGLGSV